MTVDASGCHRKPFHNCGFVSFDGPNKANLLQAFNDRGFFPASMGVID
jgi:hypothetical protein